MEKRTLAESKNHDTLLAQAREAGVLERLIFTSDHPFMVSGVANLTLRDCEIQIDQYSGVPWISVTDCDLIVTNCEFVIMPPKFGAEAKIGRISAAAPYEPS